MRSSCDELLTNELRVLFSERLHAARDEHPVRTEDVIERIDEQLHFTMRMLQSPQDRVQGPRRTLGLASLLDRRTPDGRQLHPIHVPNRGLEPLLRRQLPKNEGETDVASQKDARGTC